MHCKVVAKALSVKARSVIHHQKKNQLVMMILTKNPQELFTIKKKPKCFSLKTFITKKKAG